MSQQEAFEDTRRGYLTKRGRTRKNWKRRFFVLKDGSLIYYENEDAVVPKGQMHLYGAAVVYVDFAKIQQQHCIEVSTPARSLFVYADSRDEIQAWALAIQRSAIVASGGTITLTSHRLMGPGVQAQTPAAAPASQAVVVKAPVQKTTAPAAAAAVATVAATTAATPAPQPTPATAPEPQPAEAKAPAPSPFAEEEKRILGMRQPVVFTPQEQKANKAVLASVFASSQQAYAQQQQTAKKLKKSMGKLAEPQNIKLRKTLKGHEGFVNVVHVGSDQLLVSAGQDGTLRVWDADTCKQTVVLEGHTDVVKSVAVTDTHIVSSADDGSVRLWDRRANSCVHTFALSSGRAADALVTTADGRLIIAASERVIQIWDTRDNKCLADLETEHKDKLSSLALAGQYLYVGSSDHTISAWDMATQTRVALIDGPRSTVFCLAVVGDRLYAGSQTIMSWDVGSIGKGKYKLKATVSEPHRAPSVQCMAVSPDHRYMFTASIDGFVKIWELDLKNRSSPLHEMENPTKFIFGIASSQTKRRVFTADQSGVVRVWE